MVADVLPQVILGEVSDIVLRAQDGAPQGTVLEGRRVQVVKDDFLGHAFDLRGRDEVQASTTAAAAVRLKGLCWKTIACRWSRTTSWGMLTTCGREGGGARQGGVGLKSICGWWGSALNVHAGADATCLKRPAYPLRCGLFQLI